MKKLTKLGISPEKIMKNEELINLQGGYGETWCCFCGHVYAMGASYCECNTFCQQAHDMWGEWVCEPGWCA